VNSGGGENRRSSIKTWSIWPEADGFGVEAGAESDMDLTVGRKKGQRIGRRHLRDPDFNQSESAELGSGC